MQTQMKTQTAHRIEVKPTQEIPVSNTSQSRDVDTNLHPATLQTPVKAKEPIPSMRITPSAHHPVVQPPESLGPQSYQPAADAASLAQLPSDMTAEGMDQRAVDETEFGLEPVSGELIADASTGSSGNIAPAKSGSVTQYGTASSQNKGKPVVHFPEELALSPDTSPAVNTTDSSTDKHIYPVGYKPYIPPVNAEKRRWLETAISHYNRAGYYQDRDELDAAIDEYKQAILFNKNFADAYVGLSSAFMRKNDWANVVENANQALNKRRHFMDPANIGQAWFNLSTAYCVGDDFRWAFKYYHKARLAGHPATEPLRDFMTKNCTP
jgi:tetratricopeptide (TPR) repeat protein